MTVRVGESAAHCFDLSFDLFGNLFESSAKRFDIALRLFAFGLGKQAQLLVRSAES